MFQKDQFKQFLYLFSFSDIVPFNTILDEMDKNYRTIDTPFFAFDNQINAKYKYFKIEFSENLLSLQLEDKLIYFEYIKDSLNSLEFKFDKTAFLELLEGLHVNTKNLDYNNNDRLMNLLHENVRKGKRTIDDEKSCELIRMYYKYILFEKQQNLLKKIDTLIVKSENSIKIVSNPIFIKPNGDKIFINILEYLNIKDATTHGNQAKLASIFETKESKNVIFKGAVKKKEYLNYLNSVFGTEFTSKSFSDGSRYGEVIKKWISKQEL